MKKNEPQLYERINKIMLPGDYIAMRLTDTVCTTVSGLSEGIFWDFRENKVSDRLLDQFGFDPNLIPQIRPTFGQQGNLTKEAAEVLGLAPGTPVTYRAGDQPNNALSLNVFNPGEIASTAGTSGVVYGVNGTVNYDPKSRVNTFAHVNHTAEQTRLGVLLCINGTGILNSWIRRNVAPEGISYADMNNVAASVPIGSDGVSILPFGNGAERMLGNKDTGCSILPVRHRDHGEDGHPGEDDPRRQGQHVPLPDLPRYSRGGIRRHDRTVRHGRFRGFRQGRGHRRGHLPRQQRGLRHPGETRRHHPVARG